VRSRANPIKVADFVSDSCALLWLFPFGSCGFDVALLPFDRDRGYSLAGITQFHREESFESLFREIQRQLQQVLPIRTVVIPASLVAMLQCSFPVTTGCPAVFSRFFVCRRFRYWTDCRPGCQVITVWKRPVRTHVHSSFRQNAGCRIRLDSTAPCTPTLFAFGRASISRRFLYPSPRSSLRCIAYAEEIVGSGSGDGRSFDDLPTLPQSAESLAPSSSARVRRTSATGFLFASPIRMQTAKNFFPISIPAHFSTLASSISKRDRNLGLHFVSRA